jgi:hypothetical protein
MQLGLPEMRGRPAKARGLAPVGVGASAPHLGRWRMAPWSLEGHRQPPHTAPGWLVASAGGAWRPREGAHPAALAGGSAA